MWCAASMHQNIVLLTDRTADTSYCQANHLDVRVGLPHVGEVLGPCRVQIQVVVPARNVIRRRIDKDKVVPGHVCMGCTCMCIARVYRTISDVGGPLQAGVMQHRAGHSAWHSGTGIVLLLAHPKARWRGVGETRVPRPYSLQTTPTRNQDHASSALSLCTSEQQIAFPEVTEITPDVLPHDLAAVHLITRLHEEHAALGQL